MYNRPSPVRRVAKAGHRRAGKSYTSDSQSKLEWRPELMCDIGGARAWNGRVREANLTAVDKSDTIVIVRLAVINNAVFPAAVKKINPLDLRDRNPPGTSRDRYTSHNLYFKFYQISSV